LARRTISVDVGYVANIPLDGEPTISIPVDENTTVEWFLHRLAVSTSRVVAPHTYGRRWILAGQRLAHTEMGARWAGRNNQIHDTRTLIEAGIEPGEPLYIQPLPWRSLDHDLAASRSDGARVSPDDIDALRKLDDREARIYLSRFTLMQLRTICNSIGVGAGSRPIQKSRLVDTIVEYLTGRRLDAAALRQPHPPEPRKAPTASNAQSASSADTLLDVE